MDRFLLMSNTSVDLQDKFLPVALTRASDVLIVTYSKGNDFIERMIASGDAGEK